MGGRALKRLLPWLLLLALGCAEADARPAGRRWTRRATLVGGPFSTKGVSLDGIDEHLVSAIGALSDGEAALTAAVWAWVDAGEGANGIWLESSRYVSASDQSRFGVLDFTTLGWGASVAEASNVGQAPDTGSDTVKGAWVLVVGTYAPSAVKTYVMEEGESSLTLRATDTTGVPGSVNLANSKTYVGSWDAISVFAHGLVAEAALWDSVIADVDTLHDNGSVAAWPGAPVSSYRFGDTAGDSVGGGIADGGTANKPLSAVNMEDADLVLVTPP